MASRAVKKVADRVAQAKVEWATIHSIDADRVDLRIGTSASVIRNIEVVGSTDHLKPGDEVVFTRICGRPVVLAGGTASVGSMSIVSQIEAAEIGEHGHTGTLDGGLLNAYLSDIEHGAMGVHSYSTNLPHDAHSLLTGLSGDDHTQYVHTDTARTIAARHTFNPPTAAAPFILGANAQGQTVTGLKADTLNKSISPGSGLSGGGALTANRTLSVDQGYAFNWTARHTFSPPDAGAPFLLSANAQGQTVVGLKADQLNKSISAGNGLSGGGALTADQSLSVNQGYAFTWTAQHTFSTGAGLAPFLLGTNAQGQTVVGLKADQLNKSILAGSGLQGGGNLTADRTLSVKLQASSGLIVSASGLALGTPADISASTDNLISTNSHTHYVDAASAPGAAVRLLETTPEGSITLEGIAINGGATIEKDFRVGPNALLVDVDESGAGNHRVGINCVPDPQFALDVNSNIRARGYIVGKHAIQIKDAKLIAHFDGPEPFERNFTGDTSGHMGQAAVTAGGVIFRPGRFNKGAQFAEATTNLISNPSAEANVTTGVQVITNSPTVSQDGSKAVYGSNSFKLEFPGDSVTRGLQWAFSAQNSTTYTVSLYLWVEWTAGTLRLDFIGNGTLWDTTDITFSASTNGWVRKEITFTTPASGVTYGYIRIFTANSSYFQGTVWVDGIQAEAKPRATPFCDGSLGQGHSWASTPHLSPSSREATALSYQNNDVISSKPGTFMAWVYSYGYPKVGESAYLFDVRNTSNASGPALLMGSNGGLVWYYNGASVISTAGGKIPVGEWKHVAISYDFTAGAQALYIDGVQIATSVTTVPPANFSPTLYIGGRYSNQFQLNGIMDDVVFVGRALSADEIRAIYESDAPVFAETSSWGFRSSSNLVWANEEGLYVMDSAGKEALGVSSVDGKAWGGALLDKGDVLLGNTSQYLKWDASMGTLQLYAPGSSLTTEEYFQGTVDEFSRRWTSYGGSGEVSIVSGAGKAGGNVLRIGNNAGKDQRWFVSNQSIPYDPTKLYRFFIRVRQVEKTDDLTPGAEKYVTFYAGVAGRDADDAQFIRVDGLPSSGSSNQHYIATSGAKLTPVGEGGPWTEYAAYFKGLAPAGQAGGFHPKASDPAKLHEDVRFFRMLFIANYIEMPGILEVDEVRVDIVPDVFDSPWAHNSDTTTIDGGKIYTGSITANQIAAGTITADRIASVTITADKIATNTITANEIAANAITTAKLAAGAVTAEKIAANTITANEIAANAITTSELAANSVTAAKIAANTITANEIASRTITADRIAAGVITANEIASRTISADRIAAGVITANELASRTITTNRIASGAITANEIASRAITADRIATGAITANEIMAGTITADKMSVTSLSSLSAYLGTVTAGSMVLGADVPGANHIWLNDANDGTLRIGTDVKANAPFFVEANGTLHASGALLHGNISATGGTITGNLTVSGGAINAGSGKIQITDTGYYQWVNNYWAKMGDMIGAGYYRTSAISCPNATETQVTFSNTLVMYNNPASSGFLPLTYDHIYIPQNGVYLMTAYGEWGFTQAEKPFIQLAFRVGASTTWNANAIYARQHLVGPGDGLNYKPSMTLTHVMYLNAGNRVFLSARITNNNSAALNLEVSSFSLVKLM